MSTLTLTYPDIGRFADFEATRVALPRLGGMSLNETFEETLVHFEGDTQPTPFAGEGIPRAWALSVRFALAEHATMNSLIALFRSANAAADRRLMIRMNAFTVADLNPIEVVTVSAFAATPAGGRVWDVAFTANTVSYSVAV